MKLTLGKKLGLGFGVILALMVFSSAMSYLKSAKIKQTQDAMVEVRVPSIEAAQALQRDLNQSQSKGRQAILAGGESAKREQAKTLFDQAWEAIDNDTAGMNDLEPKWTLQANRDRWDDVKKHVSSLRAIQEAAIAHAASGGRDTVVVAGSEFTEKATESAEASKKSLGAMAGSFIALLDGNKEELHAQNRSLNLTMAVSTSAALVIGIFVAIILIRGTTAATQAVVAQGEAIGRSQAVIDFQMDGTIVDANENFLKAMGYTMEEIKGKHHNMFVDEAHRQSGDYREFWAKLNRGEYQAGEFKRLGKGGKEVWLQASYNPILDPSGKPHKVVKYATEITQQKTLSADYSGQISAIGKSQAVIEFQMDGTIITANLQSGQVRHRRHATGEDQERGSSGGGARKASGPRAKAKSGQHSDRGFGRGPG
jgi:PAS domain S-box-containing protein